MRADSFIVVVNGKEIITPILDNDNLAQALHQFENDAAVSIHAIPLIQNILIDLETGFRLLQREHLKHIQEIAKTKEREDITAIGQYIQNWDSNTSVNWNNSELLNKEQEIWLERMMHSQIGKPFRNYSPIVIPYRWVGDAPQWEPDPT